MEMCDPALARWIMYLDGGGTVALCDHHLLTTGLEGLAVLASPPVRLMPPLVTTTAGIPLAEMDPGETRRNWFTGWGALLCIAAGTGAGLALVFALHQLAAR